MPKVHARAVVWLGVLLACCSCAFALDPALDIRQYAHRSWKISEGFSKGGIYSIAQTPDGYLWMGTRFGLLRFDGVRNLPWQPPQDQRLPAGTIRCLLGSRDGTLWIGADGLASWKDGRLTQYPNLAGRVISTLLEDREGTVWAGTIGGPSSGRLCAIRGVNAHCYGDDGGLGPGVLALYEDKNGSLWAGVKDGLWRWKPGPPQFYSLAAEPDGIQALAEDADGALLVGWNGGIYRVVEGRTEAYPLRGASRKFRAMRILRDRNGGLWIGSQEYGLVHVHQGRADAALPTEDMSGEDVNALFEDREGDIWVGTRSGFDRFRDAAVATLTANQGLSNAHVGSLVADKDGSVWLATYGGLNRWQHGQITIPQIGSGKRDGKIKGFASNPLFRDDRGRIWVSTPREVGYLENGRFTSISGIHISGKVLSFDQDTAGNMWVVNEDFGLIRISRQNAVQQIPWARLGHEDHASFLAADPKQGGLWIGFLRGGIVYFAEGAVRASYTPADGLGEDRVSGFEFDHDGTVWVSTEGGLSRLKNNRIVTLTSRNGLPCDAINWVIEDDDRSLWLYMTCGLVRIARSELDAWVAAVDKAQGASLPIKVTVFDSSDGVRSLSEPGHYNPQVAKTPDGKLWFLPFNDVSVIDPHHIPFNKIPPPVYIEQITGDGKSYEASSGLHLPAHVRDLGIDYTALSLVAPEKVSFRYKLEGQDRDWRQVVNQRHVEYSNLPPGNYRFRVMASNNSGVWNEQGAALDFAIAPAYYQTNWFLALCVATFLALLGAAYRIRVRQLRRQESKLRDVIETMPTFAWTALPDGSVDFVNRHWQEFTGLSTEKTADAGWEAVIHPSDLKRHAENWRASLATGQPFEIEVRYRRAADGQYRWFLTRAVPLRDEQGKILKWYGVSTDIEDRKLAELERERLRADLAYISRLTTMGELTASLAHEIKQPIAAAVSNAEACLQWLAREPPDLGEVCEAATEMVKEARRSAEIINRVRSLFKKQEIQREVLDLNELITDTVFLTRDEANRRSISVRTELDVELPRVSADRVQLQQVLLNLMLNGLEAMNSARGELIIRSQCDQEGQPLISVSDTGVGLPMENADQIFNAFFTTKPQGTGMGLSISRSILESHGGRLWATANDGRGTTFYFTLPAAAEEINVPATGT
ncbi:MAG TPA: two-component regulator propeller domain-containing protein [Acidobacteriaceae bacterium]